ncbi:MAG: type II secretion system protein GspG [Alicyclobacillus macrosporangiidus]|nr:type II secretion system protein GspG [Alicyclobacillus macrosporangiidus]
MEQRRREQGERGLTLIELLAVIVILGVIAGIATPVVVGSINNSKVNTTEQSMVVIAEALQRYAVDNNGTYPSALDWSDANAALQQLVSGASGAGYLQGIPQDAWNQDFWYKSDGSYFELVTVKALNSGYKGDALYMSNTTTKPQSSPPNGWR